MENFLDHYLAAIAALIAFPLCYFSFRLFKKSAAASRKALLLLFLAGLILRFSSAWFFCLHPWDERYHAVVATHMMEHPLRPMLYPDPIRPYDLASWGDNYIWLHKPPMTMWLMAGAMKIFGKNEIVLRLPSVILGSSEALLTYGVALLVLTPEGAWFAAFLNTINGYLIELDSGRASTDHTDALMTFFVLFAIFLGTRNFDKRKNSFLLLAGVFTGVSILTKWWAGLLSLPVIFLFLWEKIGFGSTFKKMILPTAICFFVVAPWEIYTRTVFPAETKAVIAEHLQHFSTGLGHEGNFFSHFYSMLRIFGAFTYFAVFWLLWKMKSRWSLGLAAIFFWFLAPYFIFSLAATKMSGLVMIASAPIFIMIGGIVAHLRAHKFLHSWQRVAASILVFGLLAAPIQYSIERTKVFRAVDRYPVSAKNLRFLAQEVPAEGKNVVFQVPDFVEAMFYLPCSVYPNLPTAQELQRLAAANYRIFIFDSAAVLPDEYSHDSRIAILEPKLKN